MMNGRPDVRASLGPSTEYRLSSSFAVLSTGTNWDGTERSTRLGLRMCSNMESPKSQESNIIMEGESVEDSESANGNTTSVIAP